MKWDATSIAVCGYHQCIGSSYIRLILVLGFFYRASIPTDIIQHAPNPSGWGLPSAQLAATSCNLNKFFIEHQIVFGTLFLAVSCMSDS